MKTLLLVLILSVSNICETYNAHVDSVYDGDTITCDIELGFGFHLTEKIRVYGIDTPEVRGPEKVEGFIARDAVRELIDGKDVIIETHGRGKYGRIIGDVWVQDTINLSDWIVRNGYGVYKEY
jgi:endonuclease YncB( thermonuclease family)